MSEHRRTIAACLLIAMLPFPVAAQDTATAAAHPSPSMAVIEMSDLADLNTIFQREIPPEWSAPVARWINKLIARETERQSRVAPSPAPPHLNE
jgi:hypothetical protein